MFGLLPLHICPAPSCHWSTPVLAGACRGRALELVCANGHIWYSNSQRVARALVGECDETYSKSHSPR